MGCPYAHVQSRGHCTEWHKNDLSSDTVRAAKFLGQWHSHHTQHSIGWLWTNYELSVIVKFLEEHISEKYYGKER